MLTENHLIEIVPDNYIDVKDNDKFHHSLKGCEIELSLVKSGRSDEDKILSLSKYCKTHNKKCLRSGWEIGWWQGKCNEHQLYPVEISCLNCGDKFIGIYSSIYCNTCKPIAKRLVSYLHNNNNNNLYYRLDEVSIPMLRYYKNIYESKDDSLYYKKKFIRLINLNLEKKLSTGNVLTDVFL